MARPRLWIAAVGVLLVVNVSAGSVRRAIEPASPVAASHFKLETFGGEDLLLLSDLHEPHGLRRLQDKVPGVHLEFVVHNKSYSFDAPRAPSLFKPGAMLRVSEKDGEVATLLAEAFALPSFRSREASIMVDHGRVHAVVIDGDHTITVDKARDEPEAMVHPPSAAHGTCGAAQRSPDLAHEHLRGGLHHRRAAVHHQIRHQGHDEDAARDPESRGKHDFTEHPAMTRRPDRHAHDHDHDHKGDHRRLVELWTGCYTGDASKRSLSIGVGMTSKLYIRLGSSVTAAAAYLQALVSDSNIIYENQLNIVLVIGDMYLQTSSTRAPSWNHHSSCSMTIEPQLYGWSDWTKPSSQGLWHLLDDCAPPAGTIGIAWVGSLCEGSYFSTGVTYHTGTDTWTTLAHEIGHNFNANHSFEEGQGTTGGIMDYGDGTLNGEYQFNTRYRFNEICSEVDGVIGTCPHFQLYSDGCGNGTESADGSCETPVLPPSTATSSPPTSSACPVVAEGSSWGLLPFGDCVPGEDTFIPPVDDGSYEVAISTEFPFYGDVFRDSLWVNSNGALAFNSSFNSYSSRTLPRPSSTPPFVAVFWDDIDIRINGRIAVRELASADPILYRADDLVRGAIPSAPPAYASSWGFLATWDDVTYYSGSDTTPRNTFQTLLVTDGAASFAVLIYDDINWGSHAVAGFNAGDGARGYNISTTENRGGDLDERSNVGTPGVFAFRIDGASIAGPFDSASPTSAPSDAVPTGSPGLQPSVGPFEVPRLSPVSVPLSLAALDTDHLPYALWSLQNALAAHIRGDRGAVELYTHMDVNEMVTVELPRGVHLGTVEGPVVDAYEEVRCRNITDAICSVELAEGGHRPRQLVRALQEIETGSVEVATALRLTSRSSGALLRDLEAALFLANLEEAAGLGALGLTGARRNASLVLNMTMRANASDADVMEMISVAADTSALEGVVNAVYPGAAVNAGQEDEATGVEGGEEEAGREGQGGIDSALVLIWAAVGGVVFVLLGAAILVQRSRRSRLRVVEGCTASGAGPPEDVEEAAEEATEEAPEGAEETKSALEAEGRCTLENIYRDTQTSR